MTPELEPPSETELDRTTPTRAEPSRERDAFPYAGGEAGLPLPATRARGVLCSSDGATPGGRRGSTACPGCGSRTINGAGVFACLECSWTGTLR